MEEEEEEEVVLTGVEMGCSDGNTMHSAHSVALTFSQTHTVLQTHGCARHTHAHTHAHTHTHN